MTKKAEIPADFIKPAAQILGISIKELSRSLGKSDKHLYQIMHRGYATEDTYNVIKKMVEDMGKPFPTERNKSLVPVLKKEILKEKFLKFEIHVKEHEAPTLRALLASLGYQFDQIEDNENA